MRRLIGRILAWFLRDYVLADGNTIAASADEHIKIQNATFIDGMWNVQATVFSKSGRRHATVFVYDLNRASISEAVHGN